jgi:hypothetical protein
LSNVSGAVINGNSTTGMTGSGADGAPFQILNGSRSVLAIANNIRSGTSLGYVDYTSMGCKASGNLVGGTIVNAGWTLDNTPLMVGGNAASDVQLIINGAAGSRRNFRFETAGVLRWSLSADTVAEGGTNGGSNFMIQRFNNAGVHVGTPILIHRDTGLVTMNAGASITGGTIDGNVIGATTPASGTFTTTKTGGVVGATWTAGNGAPSDAQPIGSLYSRTDGSLGTRLYVSAGGGAWNAVAGV